MKLQVSSSSGKGVAPSKGGKVPGSKAKDPIQERKEAQLADEAQVHKLLLYLSYSILVCVLISCLDQQITSVCVGTNVMQLLKHRCHIDAALRTSIADMYEQHQCLLLELCSVLLSVLLKPLQAQALKLLLFLTTHITDLLTGPAHVEHL